MRQRKIPGKSFRVPFFPKMAVTDDSTDLKPYPYVEVGLQADEQGRLSEYKEPNPDLEDQANAERERSS